MKIIAFISLFFVFAAHARVYRHSSMFQDTEWKMSIMSQIYGAEDEQSILLIPKFYGVLHHSFLPTVDFSTEFILTTSQGVTQYTYFRPKSNDQIHPSYMYLSVRPFEFEPLFIRAGLINQEFLNAPLLISDWTFLGLQQEYILHNDRLFQYVDSLKIVLQQSIPSSDTGLEHLEQIQSVASFYTASVFTSSFIQNQVQTEGSLTAFYFRNLSQVAADFGRRHGNSVRPWIGGDSKFLDPFYGFYVRSKARYNLFPELGLELDASFLCNIGNIYGALQRRQAKAKGGSGEDTTAKALGYNIWLGLHIPTAKEVITVLNLEYFDNEGNASPAYYNSARYGHSGRYGWIIGLKSIFEKYNVFFDLQYAIIRSYSSAQGSTGNPNYLSFEIGTKYDKI